MRWRSQKEVISGKGQFTCGAKGCPNTTGLASFEVPFHYSEARQDKQALVKARASFLQWCIAIIEISVQFPYNQGGCVSCLTQEELQVRLCREHASQLNYRKEKEAERRNSKKRRRTSSSMKGKIGESEGKSGGAIGGDHDLKEKSTMEQRTDEMQAGAGQVSLANRLLTSVLL